MTTKIQYYMQINLPTRTEKDTSENFAMLLINIMQARL